MKHSYKDLENPLAQPLDRSIAVQPALTGLRWLIERCTIVPLLIVVMVLSWLGTLGATAAWILVFIWALRGVDHAFESLLLSVFFTFTNAAIFTIHPVAPALRWLIFGLALLRIAYDLSKTQIQPRFIGIKAFLLFVMFAAIGSLLFSPLVYFSIIRILHFGIGTYILFLGAQLLVKRDWINTIIGFGLIIWMASLVVYLAGYGYERNNRGFQGVVSHPQTLGVILGVTIALIIACWVLKNGKINLFQFLLLLSMIWGLYNSQARVGAVAALAGVVVPLLLSLRNNPNRFRFLMHPITYLFTAMFMIFLAGNPQFGQNVQQFFKKSSSIELSEQGILANMTELYLSSRGSLFEISMQNFWNQPMLGIGFGIPSEVVLLDISPSLIHTFYRNAIQVNDILIWIDSEKGFIGSSVLEETGFIGASLLALFLIANFVVVYRKGDVALLSLFCSALFVNIGEAVLFSFGGLGRYVIICIAISIAFAQRVDTCKVPAQ